MTGQQQSIGAGLLYCIAFMSRPIVMLSLNSAVLGGNNAVDNTVSAGIGLLLSLISAIPVFWLCSRYPALNILDVASGAMGRVGLLVPILYLLYFILMGCYYVSFFAVFIGNVMDPKMPAWLIALGVIAVSCYGAKRGLEAIARARGLLLRQFCWGFCLSCAHWSRRYVRKITGRSCMMAAGRRGRAQGSF